MLDLRSFVLAFVVINLTYAALISAFLNTIRIDQPALRLWRWANITSGSAMSLLWLRPWIPLELSLNLAHALTILGIGLELATYALFLGRVKWLSPVLAGTVIGIVVQGLVLLLASSRHPALLALSVIGMTIKAMAALLMFRSRRDSPGVSLAISLTDGAIAAILLGRTVLGLTNFELLAFDPTVINQALYLAAFINYVVNGFGFLLLVQGAANRPSGREWLNSPLVWAIEESHQRMYLFPRECPRILLWATPKTTAEDAKKWLEGQPKLSLAIIEHDWLERLQLGKVIRYEMPTGMFHDTHDAGMWVSRVAVNPLDKVTLTDLPARLKEVGTELRVVDSLLPWKDVWSSTVHASGIRLRNAKGWPAQ